MELAIKQSLEYAHCLSYEFTANLPAMNPVEFWDIYFSIQI